MKSAISIDDAKAELFVRLIKALARNANRMCKEKHCNYKVFFELNEHKKCYVMFDGCYVELKYKLDRFEFDVQEDAKHMLAKHGMQYEADIRRLLNCKWAKSIACACVNKMEQCSLDGDSIGITFPQIVVTPTGAYHGICIWPKGISYEEMAIRADMLGWK